MFGRRLYQWHWALPSRSSHRPDDPSGGGHSNHTAERSRRWKWVGPTFRFFDLLLLCSVQCSVNGAGRVLRRLDEIQHLVTAVRWYWWQLWLLMISLACSGSSFFLTRSSSRTSRTPSWTCPPVPTVSPPNSTQARQKAPSIAGEYFNHECVEYLCGWNRLVWNRPRPSLLRGSDAASRGPWLMDASQSTSDLVSFRCPTKSEISLNWNPPPSSSPTHKTYLLRIGYKLNFTFLPRRFIFASSEHIWRSQWWSNVSYWPNSKRHVWLNSLRKKGDFPLNFVHYGLLKNSGKRRR